MQALANISTHPAPINQTDAQGVAEAYVTTYLDAAFAVVNGTRLHHALHGRETWQFVIRGEHGLIDTIEVDAETGEIIPISEEKIRVIQEKAAIYRARKQGQLPVDAQGYVLGEYARRQAERYLSDHLGMYFNAIDPVFVLGDLPRWQVTVVFKRYHSGPFTLGIMDVDAKTGEPVPLSKPQLKRIRERVHALVAVQPQTAAA